MKELDSLSCSLEGAHLIEAAAGTGKTYNIQNLVVRLLLERDFSIENIAVVTFTEAAADELRQRLRKVINETCAAASGTLLEERPLNLVKAAIKAKKQKDAEKGIERSEENIKEEIIRQMALANLDFDQAEIGTIHGFCQRLLKNFAFESGEPYTVELLNDHGMTMQNFILDAYRSLCYCGKWASVFAKQLNLGNLKELVKRKNEHPEIQIKPPAPEGISLDEALSRLDTMWKEFRNRNTDFQILLNDLIVTDKKGKSIQIVNGLSFKMEQITRNIAEAATHDLPTSGDIETAEKLRRDFICEKLKKDYISKEPELREKHKKIFDLTGELCDLYAALPLLLRDEAVSRAIRRYDNFKRTHNKITFDDMLTRTADALRTHKELIKSIQKRLKVGIIDEFQDTNSVQWEIFNTLFSQATLFLVGDPRQAIYGFRGGDIETYLSARETIPEENRHTLTTNHRSCKGLIDQINTCFGNHSCAFAHPGIVLPLVSASDKDPVRPLLIDKKEDDKPLKIINTPAENQMDAIADTVISLLTAKKTIIPETKDKPERKIGPDDIAILVRNWETGRDIKQQLALRNVPAVILDSNSNVFDTDAAEELQRVLEGILDITNNSSVRLALITSICGISLETLAQDPQTVAEKTEKLANLGKLWKQNSFYVMFKKLLNEFRVEARYTCHPNGLRDLTDLIQLGDLLHKESSQRNLEPRSLLDFLIYSRSNPKSPLYPREQETDSGAVIILTEHGSKGLQYPIVLLPELNSRIKEAACYHKNGILTTQIVSKKQKQWGDKNIAILENLRDDLRLTYVAITRAEHACYIFADDPLGELTPLNWLWNKRNLQFSENDLLSRLTDCNNLEELPVDCLIQAPAHAEYTPPAITEELKAQEMPKIPGPCITTSFSSMAPGHSGQLYQPPEPDDKDDDEDDSTEDGLPPPEKQTDPLRRLKGKNFGLLLHGIMETVDFTASDDIITEAVKRDILLSEPTEEEINYSAQVISNTLKLQLPGGPRISEISKEKRLTEMRFHFRFNSNLNKGELRTAAAQHLAEEHEKKYDDHITYHGGFLTGSIDLLFEHDGKYYVLDWKSNLLPEYSPAMLKQSIIHSYYQMQYLIYLAAVIRLLKQRLNLSEEEAYEKIGGVYYVYMRGVDSEHPENGVFFDRPEYSEITKITGLLK